MDFTLIIPYYRNEAMLLRQIEEWQKYRGNVSVIVVDDGSPERAAPHIIPLMEKGFPVRLFRVLKDIPWNRNGARNLGAMQAETDWILHTDIDHILPVDSADALALFQPADFQWYRFSRYRVGKADFTRKKDDLPSDCEFGRIKPHMDSYLCRRDLYMALGGYDEDYTGGLGGGTPFVKELNNAATRIDLPEPYTLHVHTTDSVPDASDIFLSRDNSHYKAVNARKRKGAPKKPMCEFDWVEVKI
jgi:glycosyltransferase involved in cell wall biosynthesis